MTDLPPLGLDLAKLKFNACLIREGGRLRHKVFPNTAAGFVRLSEWPEQQGARRAHACLEATGTHGDSPATHLHEAGHMTDYRRRRICCACSPGIEVVTVLTDPLSWP
jgi:transposase